MSALRHKMDAQVLESVRRRSIPSAGEVEKSRAKSVTIQKLYNLDEMKVERLQNSLLAIRQLRLQKEQG